MSQVAIHLSLKTFNKNMEKEEKVLEFESGREHASIIFEGNYFKVIWHSDNTGGEFTCRTVGELIDRLPFFLSVEQFARLREELFF